MRKRNKLNKDKKQKKWKFWVVFKKSFLKTKSKKFTRLKHHIDQKRILWHQMQILYGKKIKSVLYKSHWKTAHNSKFYECLILIELRLNIVLLRIKFTSKILVASFLIRKGCVVVNEKQKQKNYILKVGDTLRLITTFVSNKRKTKIKWRRLKRISNLKKKKMHRLNWGKSLYWKSKSSLFLNFILINYLIFVAILIRRPLAGEILIKNNKKLLSLQMLKKIYFLY